MGQGLIQTTSAIRKKEKTTSTVSVVDVISTPTEIEQEKKKMRMPRSKKYIRLIQQVDALSDKDKEIMDMVQSMPVNNKMIGILSECGIKGCIIHAIDKWGNILAHYKDIGEMSSDLQDGYHVYQEHRGCTSVEIYTHTFCVIYDNGTVKFIERT